MLLKQPTGYFLHKLVEVRFNKYFIQNENQRAIVCGYSGRKGLETKVKGSFSFGNWLLSL